MQFGKEAVKLSLYADDKVVYINDLKNSMRKVLRLINTLIKIAGYKTNSENISKPPIYKWSEKDIQEKLTNQVEDFYNKKLRH